MMSDDSGKSKKLSLSGSRLTLGGLEAGQLRATPGGAGRRTVQVEVRRNTRPSAFIVFLIDFHRMLIGR